VVGLGNPGSRYRGTRHNVGFEVVEALRARAAPGTLRPSPDWWALETVVAEQPVVLLEPTTFMNRSGLAVAEALRLWGEPPQRLLVVVDDVALPTGRLRIRARGSHGGHNGLRSIEEALGTRDYPRLRIGVGPGDRDSDLADHVLSKFDSRDILTVRRAVGRAEEAVLAVLREGVEAAMNRYNAEAEEAPAAGAGDAT
jgi:PTH1 family peptidyl-tRNA hydrolase